MAERTWKKGYLEVKNVIHNEMGLTKEEIKDIFRDIAREEIQGIVEKNETFIYKTMEKVIKGEMMKAVNKHKYPEVSGNMRIYGLHGSAENTFANYVSGVMKEEIVKEMEKSFSVNVDITKKQAD